MNPIGAFFLGICLAIFIAITLLERSDKKWTKQSTWGESLAVGARWGGACAAVVLAVWVFMATVYSTFERNSCKTEAAGYDLDYDWSIRNDCRIYLPSGQLVPANKIRITSDGEIVTGEGG